MPTLRRDSHGQHDGIWPVLPMGGGNKEETRWGNAEKGHRGSRVVTQDATVPDSTYSLLAVSDLLLKGG